jgi:hypothetical protein
LRHVKRHVRKSGADVHAEHRPGTTRPFGPVRNGVE